MMLFVAIATLWEMVTDVIVKLVQNRWVMALGSCHWICQVAAPCNQERDEVFAMPSILLCMLDDNNYN